MSLFSYFIFGTIMDLLISGGWYALEKRWIIGSALSTILQTVLGYTIFYSMVFSGNFTTEVVALSLGCGFGTAIIVTYKKYRNKGE